METWLPIIGFEKHYEISNLGRIRSLHSGRVLAQTINKRNGYAYVNLCWGKRKNCSVHRLLCTHFLPNPKGFKVTNHINGNQLDNRLENLEWCTHQYNIVHAFSVLGRKGGNRLTFGTKHHNAKLNDEKVRLIRSLYKPGPTHAEIAKVVGVSKGTVTHVLKGKIWKHVK